MTERFRAASGYVEALHSLPPTWDYSQVLGKSWVLPDPVSASQIRSKLDSVNRAEAEMYRVFRESVQASPHTHMSTLAGLPPGTVSRSGNTIRVTLGNR